MPGSLESEPRRSAARSALPGGLFAVLLVATLALSWGARLRHLRAWDAQPETSFSQGVPASSSDSYYWFRVAREIRAGGAEPGTRDSLRAWPEGTPRGPTPAFPWLIARLSRASGADVYRAGIALNVLLSSLFIVPLALFARGIGCPLAGLLGGFLGGLSQTYVERSSVHRVDTDGGNLFFVFLLALGIGSLRADATPRRNLIVAALSGLCLAAFCRWYGQPGFWWVYVATGALYLAFGGFARRRALLLGLVFALCANPLTALPGAAGIAHFLRYYALAPAGAAPGPLDYASITRDISELRPIPLARTLAEIVDVPAVSALGLVGFVAFAALRWRRALPLLPVALLGFSALPGAQRFGMYLAPLAGIGWGFALGELAAAWTRHAGVSRRLADSAACLAAVGGAALLLDHTGFAIAPEPSVPVRMIASLQRLAKTLPAEPAVLAAWGRGYLLSDVTGAASLNDGEAPDPLVHYLFARAIASPDPRELQRIVAVLSTFGRRDLHAAIDGSSDPQAALDALLQRDAATAGNVVLLLTEKDVPPFAKYFRIGHWRFDAGRGPVDGFDARECAPGGEQRLRCTKPGRPEIEVDLAKGSVDGRPLLRRILELRDGVVVRESEHAPAAALSLQLVPRDPDGAFTGYFVSERVFQSNFNQLYLLGRFDPALFEEIHRDVPVARAFRVRAAATP